MDAPATYRIQVQGQLSESWSERLGGLGISSKVSGEQRPITVLLGRLADQAALLGVLNTLYDLYLPLLFVECMSKEPPVLH